MRLEQANDLLTPGYLALESGVIDHGDGFRTVCALTRMPGCKADMVEWWFRWLGGTDQYRLWHPTDHVFSDWEGRQPGTHIGSSIWSMNFWRGRTGLCSSCASISAIRRSFSTPNAMPNMTGPRSAPISGCSMPR